MPDKIKPEDIGRAIEDTLTIYGSAVNARVNDAGRGAIRKLVKLTKASAPRGKRSSGKFASSIASKEEQAKATGNSKFVWYVRPPNHRLTHLLVHGHATKDGGRTKADPFLANALDIVLPEYEKAIEEAVKNDN